MRQSMNFFIHKKVPLFVKGWMPLTIWLRYLRQISSILWSYSFWSKRILCHFFYYIDECFKFFKNVSENRSKIKLEKNKWDIFYYKHLLRYSHNSNYKIMVENFQKLFIFFVTMLDEFLYDWKQQISKENNYE